MRAHVCVYLCTCVYLVFIVCMCMTMCANLHGVCTDVCICRLVCVYEPLCDFVYTYVSIYERVCVWMFVHVYMSTCGNVLVHFPQWDLFLVFQEVIYFLICELYECRTAKWSQNIIRNYWVEEWEDEKVWILTLWYQNVTIL